MQVAANFSRVLGHGSCTVPCTLCIRHKTLAAGSTPVLLILLMRKLKQRSNEEWRAKPESPDNLTLSYYVTLNYDNVKK